MLRLLIFLVGILSTRRPEAVSPRPARDWDEPEEDAASGRAPDCRRILLTRVQPTRTARANGIRSK